MKNGGHKSINMRIRLFMSLHYWTYVIGFLGLISSSCHNIKPKPQHPSDKVGNERDADRVGLTEVIPLKIMMKLDFSSRDITTYEDVKPFLDANCVTCHKPGGDDPNLQSYPFHNKKNDFPASILQAVQRRVHDPESPMPPAGLLGSRLTDPVDQFIKDGGVLSGASPGSLGLYKVLGKIKFIDPAQASPPELMGFQPMKFSDGFFIFDGGDVPSSQKFSFETRVIGPKGSVIRQFIFESISPIRGSNRLRLKVTEEDSQPPKLLESKRLTVSQVDDKTLRITWKKAFDNHDSASELRYSVYWSRLDNIRTLASVLTKGSLVKEVKGTTRDQSLPLSVDFSTLNRKSKKLYFNVIVQDKLGNQTAYQDEFVALDGVAQSVIFNLSVIPIARARIVTFEDVKSIFIDKCTRCHESGGTSPFLERFPFSSDDASDSIISNRFGPNQFDQRKIVDSILKSIQRQNSPMPDGGERLSDEKINLIKKWSDDGLLAYPPSLNTLWSYSITVNWRQAENGLFRVLDLDRTSDFRAQVLLPALEVGTKVELEVTVKGPLRSQVFSDRMILKIGRDEDIAFDIRAQEEDFPTIRPFTWEFMDPGHVKISWQEGGDRITASENLEYMVVASDTTGVFRLPDIYSQQTQIIQGYQKGVLSMVYDSDRLLGKFINVVVRDEHMNETVGWGQNIIDRTSPTPGAGGVISLTTIKHPQSAEFPQGSEVKITWEEGTDLETVDDELSYRLVVSEDKSITNLHEANLATEIMPLEDEASEFSYSPQFARKYYFNVIISDPSGRQTLYTPAMIRVKDSLNPIPSETGKVTTRWVSDKTAQITWELATDNASPQSNLDYAVFEKMDSCQDFATRDEIEANGRKIMDWKPLINPDFVSNSMRPGHRYCFNVMVRDEAGNIVPLSAGAEIEDTIPPRGTRLFPASASAMNRLKIRWVVGLDNQGLGNQLDYQIVASIEPNISTVADARANARVMSDFSKREFNRGGMAEMQVDLGTETLYSSSGLALEGEQTSIGSNQPIFFNVLVRDQSGNIGIYNTIKYDPRDQSNDVLAPTPGGSGTVALESEDISLRWSLATDDRTPKNGLRYTVVASKQLPSEGFTDMVAGSNVSDVNGGSESIFLNKHPETMLDFFDLKNSLDTVLSEFGIETESFYVTILVEDSFGNMSQYQSTKVQVPLDLISPKPGVVLIKNLAEYTVTLQWTEAIDERSNANNLQYKLISALTAETLETTARALKNGREIAPWETALLQKNLKGLLPGHSYYFLVLVRDHTGNIARYPLKVVTIQEANTSTEAPYDILAHGRECGERLGFIEAFDCTSDDFQVIPVTVNGVERSDFPEFEHGGSGFLKCDKPSLLAGANWCQPYSRIGRLKSYSRSGAIKKNTETVAICRRIARRSGRYLLDGRRFDPERDPDEESFEARVHPIFEDVAVIQQDKVTGETCFFQMRGNLDSRRVPPPSEAELPTDAPDHAVAATDYWFSPEKTAGLNCQQCHDSDPWVHTPYIDQILGEDQKPLVPSHPKLSYSVIGRRFFTNWLKTGSRPLAIEADPMVDEETGKLEKNKCTSCHRVGSLNTCRQLLGVSTGRSFERHYSEDARNVFSLSHWMPPEGRNRVETQEEWDRDLGHYKRDAQALQKCCNLPGAESCSATPILVPPAPIATE